jgi:hypothetical protein
MAPAALTARQKAKVFDRPHTAASCGGQAGPQRLSEG